MSSPDAEQESDDRSTRPSWLTCRSVRQGRPDPAARREPEPAPQWSGAGGRGAGRPPGTLPRHGHTCLRLSTSPLRSEPAQEWNTDLKEIGKLLDSGCNSFNQRNMILSPSWVFPFLPRAWCSPRPQGQDEPLTFLRPQAPQTGGGHIFSVLCSARPAAPRRGCARFRKPKEIGALCDEPRPGREGGVRTGDTGDSGQHGCGPGRGPSSREAAPSSRELTDRLPDCSVLEAGQQAWAALGRRRPGDPTYAASRGSSW